MQFLRANTQIKVVIGPVVAVANGYVPVTTLTLSGADEAEIMKSDASAVTDISGATFAAITSMDGYYNLTLTTSHTDTEGLLTVGINDDSLCLPVKHTFMVLAEAAYDSMFVAKDDGFMDVNIKTVGRADTQETEATNLEAACAAYSATRGLTGTALPAAAADAAGGVPISNAGGLDLDAKIGALTFTVAGVVNSNPVRINSSLSSIAGIEDLGDHYADEGHVHTAEEMLNTTVATVTSQTSIALTTGTNGNNAYNGQLAIFTRPIDGYKAVALIDTYTASGFGLTLKAAPAGFTITVNDMIDIIAVPKQLPTGLADGAGGFIVSDAGGLDADAQRSDVAAILVDTAEIGTAGAGLTNINLPNQTMDIVGNITGNLSGSVGSVTGAVGSVTGAVGSVTGNVGGNVTGSVGSVATGGISAASFAAGAIDAAAIAAAAIDAATFAADVDAEVRSWLGLASANLDTQLADLPTVAEFNARTLVAADYTIVSDLGVVQTADHTASIAAILADTGTDGVVISAATQNAIADALLIRSVTNTQDTADAHSLTTIILATLESSRSGTTWTIKKTGGTTFATKTLTEDAAATPVTGVT